MTLTETTTNKGNPAVLLNNFKFRKYRTLASGEIVWRCLNKNCNIQIKTDLKNVLLSDPTTKHNHPPYTSDSIQGDNSSLSLNDTIDRAHHDLSLDKSKTPITDTTADILSAESDVFDKFNLSSTPIKSITKANSGSGDSEVLHNIALEALRRENFELTERMSVLQQQWSDAVDHSIAVDRSLMEYKDTVDRMKVSIEVLEAENSALKSEKKSLEMELNDLNCFYSPGNIVTHQNYNKKNVLLTKNSFSALQDTTQDDNIIMVKQTKKTKPRKVKKRRRVLVIADSHGRDLGWDLNCDVRDDGFEATVISKPGGSFRTVTEDIENFTRDFNFDDRVIVIAGTNDIVDSTIQPTDLDLEPIIATSRRTRVSIATVPYRYDRPLMNVNVGKFNSCLTRQISQFDGIDLMDLGNFEIADYTRHGLHLNKSRGKQKLKRLLKNQLTGDSGSTSGKNIEVRIC
ncbi:hypothetical protein LSTR_LSTR016340 [Laodelphax striatellus]|uniref:FLYWCH-type domain-containing protein n=1 Tax=Laodelphax striatellus TaxID=195883 RepID=A0A482XM22_LAOST|nr:hypothetical protein LSTR_LSTR016340 [Laodelphax striatellus]